MSQRGKVGRIRVCATKTWTTSSKANRGQCCIPEQCGLTQAFPTPGDILPCRTQSACRRSEAKRNRDISRHSHGGLPCAPKRGRHGMRHAVDFHQSQHRRVGHLHPQRQVVIHFHLMHTDFAGTKTCRLERQRISGHKQCSVGVNRRAIITRVGARRPNGKGFNKT